MFEAQSFICDALVRHFVLHPRNGRQCSVLSFVGLQPTIADLEHLTSTRGARRPRRNAYIAPGFAVSVRFIAKIEVWRRLHRPSIRSEREVYSED